MKTLLLFIFVFIVTVSSCRQYKLSCGLNPHKEVLLRETKFAQRLRLGQRFVPYKAKRARPDRLLIAATILKHEDDF